MKPSAKVQAFASIRCLIIVTLASAIAVRSPGVETNAKRQHDFAKLKEFAAGQNFSGLYGLERDTWLNSGIDSNYEPLAGEQQTEINELAMRLAKKLSLHSTVSPAEADKPNRPAGDYNAAETLRSLCVLRVVNDPNIIPLLIDALDHRYDVVAEESHEALRLLTRRMSFAQMPINPLYGKTELSARVISWWKQWWKENKDKHPIFDIPIEEKAKAEVVRVASAIEKEVKPKYPELTLFRSPEKISYSYLAPIFRIESDPRLHSLIVPNVARDKLALVEIACNFETPDWDGKLAGERESDHRLKYPTNLLDVYNHKLEGTDIFIRVRIGTSNTNLLTDLRSAISAK